MKILQNVLKIQTRKIGKNEEILVAMDMPELAESIKVGLVIFVGSDVAKTIATNISLQLELVFYNQISFF